jgi:RNA polymerase sigma-70 factor (ECF subfamily)
MDQRQWRECWDAWYNRTRLDPSSSSTKGINAAPRDSVRIASRAAEVKSMIHFDVGTTNPTLLNRLGDWRDREAWLDFVTRYDPVIRSTSRRYGLDAETTDELCQRVWIDLARRMRSFRYDPGRTFRGWLRRLCHSRAIDLLRKKKSDAEGALGFQAGDSLLQNIADRFDALEEAASEHPLLLQLAQEVQDGVRRRVDERTWQVFWKIAVLGQTIREASEAAGISYYAAFAAQKRVGRMLREDGQRLLAQRRNEPASDGPEIV